MAATDDWNAKQYEENASFVADLVTQPLIEGLLKPQAGERILDLGCGDGRHCLLIASSGASVLGVDNSESMVTAARERGADAERVDAQQLTFQEEFDAVFSNATLHWCKKADKVLDGVRRALKPGGRFVGEFGGFLNVATVRVALLAILKQRGLDGKQLIPWYFPSVMEYKEKLESHGFTVRYIEHIPRPTLLPAPGIRGWLATFGRGIVRQLEERKKMKAKETGEEADGAGEGEKEGEEILEEMAELLEEVLVDAKGDCYLDYYRLRFEAFL